VEDERFVKNLDRVTNHADLKEIIEKWSSNFTIDELVDRLLELGIPAAPINTIDRIVNDPHIAGAREMFVEVDHPVAGKNKITGNHIKFSDLKADVRTAAPTLGQHNEEVYSDFIGLSIEKIKELKDKKII
jgi:formyl-CoA transferase